MISVFSGWAISVITGILLINIFLSPASRFHWCLRMSLGIGCGIGVSSFLFYMVRLFTKPNLISLYLIDCAVLLGLLFYSFISTMKTVDQKKNSYITIAILFKRIGRRFKNRFSLLVLGSVGIILVLFLVRYIFNFYLFPFGANDAWAIWNLHACFLLQESDIWLNGFTNQIAWSHPDYPLLLPCAVARLWIYGGGQSVFVPAIIALSFACATLGCVVFFIHNFISPVIGYCTGALILATPHFLRLTVSQYADLPISFFFASTLIMTAISEENNFQKYRYYICQGFLLSCAVWTKNEGALFVIAYISAFMLSSFLLHGALKQRLKIPLFVLAGMLPIIVAHSYFKVFIAPTNDLVAGQSVPKILQQISDLSRYIEIVKCFGYTLCRPYLWGPILLFFPLGIIFYCKSDYNRKVKFTFTGIFGLFSLIFIFFGYFYVYLTTPHDLVWHLYNSMDRLIFQLLPFSSIWFLLFIHTKFTRTDFNLTIFPP